MLSLIVLFGAATLLACFWPQICSFLSVKVIPWIRENWGEKFANPLITITQWLNEGIRGIRRGFKDCVLFIKERVLMMKMTAIRTPNGEIIGERVIKVEGENGDVVTIKKPVDPSTLPIDIQNAIIRQMPDENGNRGAQQDEKQLLLEKAKERLIKDRGLPQSQAEVAELKATAEILEMSV